MKRGLKWLGYIVGGFVALVVIAVGTVYAMTSSRLARTYPLEVETVAIPTDSASIERGRHLVQAVGKCADCHGENLAGTRVMDAGIFMKLTAPNLTAGQGGTGSRYADADWVRAIRYGVRPDQVGHIHAVRSVHRVERLRPRRHDRIPEERSSRGRSRRAREIAWSDRANHLPHLSLPPDPGGAYRPQPARPEVTPGVTVEYGKYLSDAGGCTGCHLPTLGGGQAMEQVVTTNLTRGGPLASWTEQDFIKGIRTGVRPDGTTISDVMPWKSMGHLTDDELRATWLFLRSVPPVS